MKKRITFWNARRQSGTVKLQFHILGIMCLLGMLIVIPATAMDVQVVVDPEDKGLSFAAGDIDAALKRRGHTPTLVRPDKMNGATGVTISLASLGDDATQKAFAAAGGKLPTGLQPEGYAIRSTGTGYVQLGKAHSALTFTYDAPAAGEYMLEFRYILENGNSNMPILINGAPVGTINFWSTGGPSSWAWDRKTVRLNSGSNTITLKSPFSGVRVDHLNVLRP